MFPLRSAASSVGDVRSWVALDVDTKLVPAFVAGNRDARSAKIFVGDMALRLATRIQPTTDGLHL
jgi:hypothetical protein